MMKKLGLAIQVISSGAQPPVVWNGDGAWENEVRDVRTYASLLVAPLSPNEVLPFLTIGREGCFITLLKTLTGRGGDCSTAWLYIPRTIAISDDEVLDAYRLVKEHITQGGNDAAIEEFFDKEYEEKEVPPTYAPSQGNSVAVRYYTGDDELRDLLGEYRYQKYYSQYEAVFLLDKDSTTKANQSITDISGEKLKRMIVVNPPTAEDLKKMGEGTRVFIKNKEFVKPRAVEEGTSLTLRFTRPGFEDITPDKIIVDGEGTLTLPKKPWQRKISKEMFSVYDNKGQKVEDVQIFVNGANITQQKQHLTEEECKKATVQIAETDDYEAYEEQHNLLSDYVHITLTRKIHSRTYRIELKNREEGQLTITSDMMPNGCPLETYEIYNDGGEDLLRVGLWYKWKHYLIGFAAAIALVVCVVAYIAISEWWDGHTITWGWPPIEERGHTKINPPEALPQTTSAEEKGDDNTAEVRNDDENAIAYLDHTLTWAEDSLEKYALTKGLYDELNYYRFADICNRTGKIEESSKFLEIRDLANKMVEKKITMPGQYSKDGTITPSEWEQAVNNKLTPQQQQQQQQQQSQSQAGGNTSSDGEKQTKQREL